MRILSRKRNFQIKLQLVCSCNSIYQGSLLDPNNQCLVSAIHLLTLVIVVLYIFNRENTYKNRRFWNLAALERTSVLEHDWFLYMFSMLTDNV